MAQKVEKMKTGVTEVSKGIHQKRELWTVKEDKPSKLIPSGAHQKIKFKKQKKQILTASISPDDKYNTNKDKNTTTAVETASTNKTKSKSFVNTTKTISKEKRETKHWDSEIIPWQAEITTTIAEKKHKNLAKTSNNNLTENNYKPKEIDEIKTWIVKSKIKKKHNKHSKKLNTLEKSFKLTISPIDSNNIQAHQVENKQELIDWLNKVLSKKNFINRKLQNRMSTEKHTNRFSALATDDEEFIESETNNLVTPTNKTTDTTATTSNTTTVHQTPDTIMTIVNRDKKLPPSNITTTPTSRMMATQTPRSSIPPPIPQVQTEPWQVVGSKQDSKEEMYNNEEYSNRFSPVYLPPTPRYNEDWKTEKYTKNVLPVTMRITAPKNYKVKNGRALVALMRILQRIDQTTYIGPIDTTSQINNLLHPNMVPKDEDSLSYYMEQPTTGRYKNYSVRIYICTNRDLDFFKKDQELIDYLGGESIALEYNDLDSVLPPNVGFLLDIIPRPETIQLHKDRIKQLLPTNAPRFNMSVQTIHGPDNSNARVFMVKCDKMHLTTLTRMFRDIDENHIKFFPWNSYAILQAGQKLTIINRQLSYANSYRSLLLNGFKDHTDNITMKLLDPDDMEIKPNDDELNDVLVTDYLRYYVHSSQGNNLFEYVFPPYSGEVREFIVKVSLVAEAASFLEYGKGELARHMSNISIEAVFVDPEEAYMESSYPPWKPFSHAINIPVTELKNPYQSDNKNKRTRNNLSDKRSYSRNNNENHHQNPNFGSPDEYTKPHYQSYSSITKSTLHENKTNNYTPPTGNTVPPANMQTQTTFQPNSNTNTTSNFQPMSGLGGGITPPVSETTFSSKKITEMEDQINRMEDDLLQLKRSVAKSNQSVQKLEETITQDIQNIDQKLNTTSNDLWKRVENKIDNNNALLQDQVSDIMATKLSMNNQENNASLLEKMGALMQIHFEKVQDSNKETTTTLTTLSENQDMNIQQLNTKMEKTTKQLTEMIDNVALARGQRSGRYVTRSTIAKSLVLNATKITKSFMDKDGTTTMMDNDEEVIFTMETDTNNNTNTENKENQHEVTAIVKYCHK
jgi:hypothetical protein